MIAEAGERAGGEDHGGVPRHLVHDRAGELRQGAPQLELAECLDRAGAGREAEREGVQAATDERLDVVVDGEAGLELVRELDECVRSRSGTPVRAASSAAAARPGVPGCAESVQTVISDILRKR